MKKIGRLVFAISILMIGIFGKPVYAEEYYFTNEYGVSFTEEAYNFFTDFFYDGYQKLMTQEMYDEYNGFDFNDYEIEKVSLCVNDAPNSMREHANTRDITYFANYTRSLDMAKICGAFCRVSLVVQWFGIPAVKSYDVIGAYLSGPTRFSTPITTYTSSLTSGSESAIVYDTDGYGAVVPVPDGTNLTVSQSFAYTGTGFIFMSHQHAMSTISLSDAQSFNIGLSGYGNVFQFYGGATNVYDQMNGVYMTV